MSVIRYADYSHLTTGERRALLGADTSASDDALISADDTTMLAAQTQAADLQKDLDRLEQQEDDVKKANVAGLAEIRAAIEKLQADLEAKQRQMMAELEKRKAEMEAAKEKMELEIYRLDSEIYCIRCYTGECMDFTLVRDGRPADASTPIVLHQSMRYMDEELGKIASIYDVDFSDHDALEAVLKYNDIAFEQFVPTKRSITLCRVSRNNKHFKWHEKWVNMLQSTQKYRGSAIAVIIRDGERLFVGWTDDERISFPANMFFRPGVSDEADVRMEQGQYESDKEYEKRMKAHAKQQLAEALGRKFVFTILQGVIDRHMVRLSEDAQPKIMQPSPYIVYSYADSMITDERYGSFASMIARANRTISEGDMILTMQDLRPRPRDRSLGWTDNRWNNDRGRGDRNRTHDVFASDCTVYPINLIEERATYSVEISRDGDGTTEVCKPDSTESKFKDSVDFYMRHGWRIANGAEIKITDKQTHYYISLKKRWSDEARANFEVHPREFANLTYLCSAWLEYVLQQQKTGSIRIGGENVDFAHLLPYLKTALEFVRKREADELATLAEYIPTLADDPEWTAKLCDWKIENRVRRITPFQAKRFAKAYKSSGKGVV